MPPSGLPRPGAIVASSISRARSRSRAIYLECIPLFARGLVSLPDHPKLLRELRLLERHTHRTAKTQSIIRATAMTTTPTRSVVSCICWRSRWWTTTSMNWTVPIVTVGSRAISPASAAIRK